MKRRIRVVVASAAAVAVVFWGLYGVAHLSALPDSQPAAKRPQADFKMFHLYADAQGVTRLERMDVPLDPKSGRADHLPATGNVQFARFAATMDSGWHNTDRRKYLVVLSGAGFSIEVRDGTKVEFRPGSILLADDMKGNGHWTRALGGDTMVMYVTTAEAGGGNRSSSR
jgi:mannose-6-phosphate isomerase-like protein (cupin superfamily)